MKEVKQLSTEIVKFTKQDGSLTVIFTTSEYANLYMLQELMNLLHISRIMVAGELTPKVTWDLLVSDVYPKRNATVPEGKRIIGRGPYLLMQNAADNLFEERESFTIQQGLPRLLSSGIQACLRIPGSRKLLSEMAELGFAPLGDYSSDAARLIAKSEPWWCGE